MGSKKRLEIMPQVIDTTQRRITLNVGGQKHETYLSTIRNYPDTRLYWVVENVTKTLDYHSEKIELFFDRHPAIFSLVLNYYRTGKLHCPNDVCGPLFEEELAYWGIDEKDMEPCCWTTYIQHRDAENNLKSFNVPGFEREEEREDDRDKPKSNGLNGKSRQLYPMWLHYQPKVWSILEEPRSSRAAKVFSILSVALIMMSVAAYCAITLPQFSNTSGSSYARVIFLVIEYVCGIFFTLELVLRVIFCPNKRALFKGCFFWIDILSVLPFYLRLIITNDGDNLVDALLMIRLLRLFRFFRLLYGLQVLLHTLKASSYELFLLLIILLIPVVLFSSIIFYVEKSLDTNTQFRSIPESFWWSLITMTTVGYGDMTPKSWLGKIIGGMCAIFGVLMVALPISVIGSNFNLYYAHAQARLTLPKKKNKFHFDSLTAAVSRQATRRRAMRKRSPRWSGSEDVMSLCSRANSAVKTNNFDLRSWSIASGKSTFDQVNDVMRSSPCKNTAKRKISRERRISRNERSPPKLGDLLEHEENEHSSHANSPDENLEVPRLSLSNSMRGHDNTSTQMPLIGDRSRSYSMPTSSQRAQAPGLQRKTRSDSAHLCERCTLLKDETIHHDDLPDDWCHCQEPKRGRYKRHSSSFTLVIPCLEGTEEWIDVSTETMGSNRGSFPRTTSFNSDISNRSNALDTLSEENLFRRNLSVCIATSCTDSDEETCDVSRNPAECSAVPLLVVNSAEENNYALSRNHIPKNSSVEIETSI